MKHLTLKVSNGDYIADGHFWQIFVKSFETFYFQFHVGHIDIFQTLDSFRSAFWLEKHWYVAVQNGYLFSLQRFSPTHIDSHTLSSFYSTAPDGSLIYQQLTKFTVNKLPVFNSQRLPFVKTLALELPTSWNTLEKLIDLNRIQHLVLPSLNYLLKLMPIDTIMPQMNKLTIRNTVNMKAVERLHSHRFERIRVLQIHVADECVDYIIEELFLLFPNVVHLKYNARLKSLTLLVRLLKGFKHLSNASFYSDWVFGQRELSFCQDPSSILRYFPQHTYDDLTCRVYHFINTPMPISIHFSIKEPVNIFLKINTATHRILLFSCRFSLHRLAIGHGTEDIDGIDSNTFRHDFSTIILDGSII